MKDLRCFAYWSVIDGVQCRFGTILVGRGNEDLIGNCIMKNPGSAAPIESLFPRDDGRLEFTVDATMYAIADLFQLDKTGGAVRIWNLSDAREPDFAQAKKIIRQVDDIREFENGVPTYVGWGTFWKDANVTVRAKRLFELVQPSNCYLNADIEANQFFHPLFLMRYGRTKAECKKIIENFMP